MQPSPPALNSVEFDDFEFVEWDEAWLTERTHAWKNQSKQPIVELTKNILENPSIHDPHEKRLSLSKEEYAARFLAQGQLEMKKMKREFAFIKEKKGLNEEIKELETLKSYNEAKIALLRAKLIQRIRFFEFVKSVVEPSEIDSSDS